MPVVHVAVSKIIQAPAAKIYPIVADYRHHHPHILPKAYLTNLDVEEGGVGAGTVFQATMHMLGQQQRFRMQVSEPEPGRIIAETDPKTGLQTTFTIDPAGPDRASVTIATTFQAAPGLRGWVERLVVPRFLRRVYRAELQQLEDYARQS